MRACFSYANIVVATRLGVVNVQVVVVNNMERWADIKGYKGYYQISDQGRVKRLARKVTGNRSVMYVSEIIMKPLMNEGYVIAVLTKNGKQKTLYVHRLVACAFLVKPSKRRCVKHINDVRDDNRVENICWQTRSEIKKYGYEVLGYIPAKGEESGKSKLTEKQVLYIRSHYIPYDRGIYSGIALALRFNVTKAAISSIINNKNWKHI